MFRNTQDALFLIEEPSSKYTGGQKNLELFYMPLNFVEAKRKLRTEKITKIWYSKIPESVLEDFRYKH